jgi:phosphate transport system permease protein
LSTAARTAPTGPAAFQRRGRFRFGDALLYGLTAVAGFAAVVLLILITWKVLAGAQLSWDTFGLGFLKGTTWNPNTATYGAATFIFGTALTSLFALLVAGPIAIAIALFLTELAPGWIRSPIGALVEMLASVPSVVLGFWGILVMGPWIVSTLSPILSKLLGWTPFFDGQQNVGSSQLAAVLILTIMIVPIVSSICRELFTNVPTELKEGALALGATRWEMIRGVVFPYSRAGIAAALILGLGRAVGEAIAVTQVIGAGTNISFNLFATGDTLASKIATSYQGANTNLEVSSVVYLAVLLLVFSLIVNVIAQVIVRRVARRQQGRT